MIAWSEPAAPHVRGGLAAAYRQARRSLTSMLLLPTVLLAMLLWFEVARNGGRAAWVLIIAWIGFLSTFGTLRVRQFVRLRADLADGVVRRVTGRVSMLFDTGRNGGRTYRLRLQDDRVLTIPITVAERVRAQRLTATRSAPVSPLSPPTEHFDLPRLTVVYAPRSGVVLEVCDADREVIYAHPA